MTVTGKRADPVLAGAIFGVALCLAAMAACAPASPQVTKQRERARLIGAAEAGEAAAQYQLAQSFCCGPAPVYDTAHAVYWYCRAAKQGFVPAQTALADVLSDNQSRHGDYLGKPPVDFIGAYVWYSVAAGHGDEEAARRRSELNNMMHPGDVKAAQEQAVHWRDTACPGI